MRVLTSVLVAALVLGSVGCGSTSDPDYATAIEEWRNNRDERLRSASGWLTLVGLHWLEPGENPFGSDPDNAVALPESRAPDRAGSFILEDGTVRVRPEQGAGVTLDGEPVIERQLRTDADGEPDILELGSLTMQVIRREDRFGIRVKDSQSEVLASFSGMEYFPVDATYRVNATFVPYDPPREVQIATERISLPVYDRRLLPMGVSIPSPAIISQLDATTLVPPGARARADEHGSIAIEPGGA